VTIVVGTKKNKEIEGLKVKNQEYLESLQRVQAEFENFQKRVSRDQENFVKFAKEDLILSLLDVLDNFDRANSEDEGVKLIHKQLHDILEKEGVVEIETKGQFDPNVHEAICKEVSDKKEGEIIEVFSKGYALHDKVIRPSKVKISGGNEE